MKRKFKLFATVASLCLCLALMAFGVYAASNVTYKATGTVSFEVTNVFVKADTTVYKAKDAAGKKVADPGVWAKEAYEIEKKESRTVGIGIGRGGLFWDYGKNFTEEQFFSLYVNLIKRLIDNGMKLSLFTNGMLLDNIFANKIQSRLLKDGISVGLNIPNSPADLVNIIASYRCIIAARLHSCIVAYSLGIPAIGFVWNDKLKLWGENIHAEEFFVDVDNLTVDFLVDKMKKSLEYKYDSIAREQFRDTVQIDISQLAKDYFSPDFESKKLCIQGG